MRKLILIACLIGVSLGSLLLVAATADPIVSQGSTYALKIHLEPGDSYTVDNPGTGWAPIRSFLTTTNPPSSTSVTNGQVLSVATNGTATTYFIEWADVSHPLSIE